MPTLNDYRKQANYKTIKAFTEAAQKAGVRIRWTSYDPTGTHVYEREISPSLMSQWLDGHRGDIDPEPLMTLLNITEEQYQKAVVESYDTAIERWRAKHPITPEIRAAHEASIKKTVDEVYAKMTPGQKERIHQEAIRLGISKPDNRSPLDIMIDRACGIE